MVRGAMSWPHRLWFGAIFVVGIFYCLAFPPFQTNDEDAHWLHMWSVVYGHLRCETPKPLSATQFLTFVHQKEVREDPAYFRVQYLRDAARWSLTGEPMTTVDGTACRYPPMAYVLPGGVARLVAFGRHGERRGGMLYAAWAARLANWVFMSLGILLLCWQLPWCRNVALFFYSIPEAIQQGMAINNDSFLVAMTAVVLVLAFGRRPAAWKLPIIGLCVGMMTMIKPVYAPLGAVGVILWERLYALHRWRWRDLAAGAAAVLVPFAMQSLWTHWLNYGVVVDPARVQLDYGRARATAQLEFLSRHHSIVFPLMWHQLRDFFFSDDLMKGSWISVFGAFGWSMFTMDRWAYDLLLVAAALALTLDIVAAAPSPDLPAPTWRGIVALVLAAGAVEVTVVGVILGMYVYFSGAFLNRIGANEVIGVQGRYHHIAILLWAAMLLHGVRRRREWSASARTLLPAIVTLTLFLCVLANVEALHAILGRFYGSYFATHEAAPRHY